MRMPADSICISNFANILAFGVVFDLMRLCLGENVKTKQNNIKATRARAFKN